MTTRSPIVPGAAALFIMAMGVSAEPIVIDPFDDPGAWRVIEADGVSLRVSRDEGVRGGSIRLDYDFTKGSGFCIIRRELDLALPANYRFDLWVRGEGAANDLEFKLVSPSGDDVWWVNRRAFAAPAEWTALRNRKRHFEFAWGPSAGAPLERIGAIEFAIAAARGGTGTIWLDELTFEELPELDTTPRDGRAFAGEVELGAVNDDGAVNWRAPAGAHAAALDLVFEHAVEFGAIELEWVEGLAPARYELLTSDDGERWTTIRSAERLPGLSHAFFMPESEAKRVRVRLPGPRRESELHAIRLVPVGEARDANAFWARRAGSSPRGWLPAYLTGERSAWTVVGEPGADEEALLSETGLLEPWKGGPGIEAMLLVDGRVVTHRDAEVSRSLVDRVLPIPTVAWQIGGLRLEQTVLASGGEVQARYRLTNTTDRDREVTLALATRPWQALPMQQWLNIVGGLAEIRSIEAGPLGLMIDGSRAVRVSEPPAEIVRGSLTTGGIAAALARGDEDAGTGIEGISAAMLFPTRLGPGRSHEIVIAAAMKAGRTPQSPTPRGFATRLEGASEVWWGLVGSPRLTLPEEAQGILHALRTAVAHILINADGAKIQPGSRTYERSWIRDGAMTSLALIATGHAETARAFVDWYTPFQYESGKVPCVVDHRGPDPVDEHDSTGQLIFAIRNVADATGDKDWLRGHDETVRRGVSYLESLIAQRSGPGYRESDDPLTRAKAGLVPESISHEGYSAKPMHSYWDCVWVLRGLEDAAAIARTLGESEDERRAGALAERFREDLHDSIRRSAAHHRIDFVPGCVELGDFDATSTAIAVHLLGAGGLPEPLLTSTFERYWDFFLRRRDGVEAWRDMTPYEWRLVGAMVRLGWTDRAHALTDWLMTLQSPPGWNQWGEIAYSDDSKSLFVGDMPHTWVASAFVSSVLSMFVFEDLAGLVLAGGLPDAWLESPTGVSAEGLWTRWGRLGFSMRGDAGGAVFELLEAPTPPGGLRVRAPGRAKGAIVDGRPARIDAGGLVSLPAGARRVEFAW